MPKVDTSAGIHSNVAASVCAREDSFLYGVLNSVEFRLALLVRRDSCCRLPRLHILKE